MNTIWKFPLLVTDEQVVALPIGSLALTVQTQREQPCLWALVDPEQPKVDRLFLTFGTGHPIRKPENNCTFNYVGTYQLEGGALVFHIFESQRLSA